MSKTSQIAVGQTYGKLTIVERGRGQSGKLRCECGYEYWSKQIVPSRLSWCIKCKYLNWKATGEPREVMLRRHRTKHAPKAVIMMRRYQAEARKQALEHYGNKCACCEEATYEFLTIDHINNDGAQHRRTDKGAKQIYLWLRKNNYPDTFQILCYNCNCVKTNYKGCPHQWNKILVKS